MRRNPLIVNRKSIKRSDKVLGSPHPPPNHVKGVFSLKSGEFCGLGFAGVKAEAGLELGKF